MKTLPEDARTRLIKLLGMLGSSHEGEVLAAARHACRLLQEHGMTWESLLVASLFPPQPPGPYPTAVRRPTAEQFWPTRDDTDIDDAGNSNSNRY